MIVELQGSDHYQVPLVDLCQHKDHRVWRTFASSEQVIDWVTHHPNIVFIAIRHGALGKKVAPPLGLDPVGNVVPASQVKDYSLEAGDIIVGDLITFNNVEGLTTPGLGYGSG